MKAASPRAKRNVALALKVCGALLLVGILIAVDLDDVSQRLASADPFWLAATLGALAVNTLVRVVRWRQVIGAVGGRAPLLGLLRYQLIGQFLSSFTPGRVGEFGKVAYLKRLGVHDSGIQLVGALVERFMEGLAFVVLAAIVTSMFLGSAAFQGLPLGVTFAASVAVAASAVVGLVFAKPLAAVVRSLGERTGLALVRKLTTQASAVAEAFPARVLLGQGLLSGVFWLIYIGIHQLAARSLGIHLDTAQVALASVVSALAAILPLSVGGFGTREAAMIGVLAALGFDSRAAVAFSILVNLVNMPYSLTGGLFFVMDRQAKASPGTSPA